MCSLGLKFFCKWADISDSEDCIFRRISSSNSPGNFQLKASGQKGILTYSVISEKTEFNRLRSSTGKYRNEYVMKMGSYHPNAHFFRIYISFTTS